MHKIPIFPVDNRRYEFSYDPPGSFITTDKPIRAQLRSGAWLDGESVHLDTYFDGGRELAAFTVSLNASPAELSAQ